jgi:choice-of-anchor A domain-containing protein
VDHLALSVFFKSTSEMIGSWDATGSLVNIYGALSFHGTGGINVVTITASELLNAWGFTINAPEDAVVYINVVNDDGSPVNLDSTGWAYAGGIAAGNVLLNLPEAESLNLTSSNNVNILAPFASTVFNHGLITGSLVVGNLEGSGQVNLGHFMAGGSAGGTPNPVPEPGTMALMLVGFLAVLMGRTRVKQIPGLKGISGRITKGWT